MEEAGMDHNRCGNCGAGLLKGAAVCANCGEKAVTSPPRGLAGVVATVLFPAIIALVALTFVWPWVFKPSSGIADLERYSPVRDGGSMLLERYDASGKLIGWESRNVTVVEDFYLLTQEQRNAVEQFYPGSERSGAVKVMQVRTRILELNGKVTGSVSLIVREPRGEFMVSSGGANRYLFYDTPILLLPAQLNTQSKWEGEGQLSDGRAYKLNGRVVESGPFEGKPGKFNNCLKVETRRLYTKGGQAAGEETLNSYYCAGMGLVETQHAGEAGRPAWSSLVVSADGLSAGINPLPYPGSVTKEPGLGDPASWSLGEVGRATLSGMRGESTITPLWIPGDPPVLLAAGHGGDMVAFSAQGPADAVRWRFHTGGTIYGPPAFDGKTSRVYFGSTDKRLYALDARGLFLWSFKTGDNVASRPAIAGDTVIFGSEDRKVYALDAGTGRLRWERGTGGPVVSSAAVIGDVAVIGSDDGGVYGLDVATGQRRWLHVAGGPVEAAMAASSDGRVYAASRDGVLYALNAADGKEVWKTDVGGVLRTAPAVGGSALFVVNESGYLSAVDRERGNLLWTATEARYTGPPLIADNLLIVAGTDGSIYRFGLNGEEQGRWSTNYSGDATDLPPAFYLGPAMGGGAIWLADNNSVIRRLGGA